MRLQDALNLLGLKPGVGQADIKTAYRKASFKYHPDRNSAGLEMMKAINEAYETLKGYSGEGFEFAEEEMDLDYGDSFNKALKAAIEAGLNIEICGAWIWVSGDTRPVKEALKASRYKWARKKQKWYFRPEKYKSRNRSSWSMEKIRTKYGSKNMRKKSEQPRQTALATC